MRRRARFLLEVLALVAAAGLGAAGPAVASGNDVALNLSEKLGKWAAEGYTGLVAVCALPFLLTRKYIELALYFVAAMVVGWFVFSPDGVANAARALAGQVLGS